MIHHKIRHLLAATIAAFATAAPAMALNHTTPNATFPGPYTHESGITILPRLTASTLTINSGQLIIDGKSQARDPSGTSVINALSFKPSPDGSSLPVGSLDVTNNAFIIDYDGSYSVDSIRQLIQSGFNTGQGILSSTTTFNSRLGYADNQTVGLSTFGQAQVDPTSILISLTYSGDTNFDGVVNIKDLYNLASHWQQTSGTWTSGDFNYDGAIDASDLTLLAENWQAGIINAPVDPGLDDLFTLAGLPLLAVPEPSAALTLSAAAIVLANRRRK